MTIAPDLDIDALDFPTPEVIAEPEPTPEFLPYSHAAITKAALVIAEQRERAAEEERAALLFMVRSLCNCSPSRGALLGDERLSITYHRWMPPDDQ